MISNPFLKRAFLISSKAGGPAEFFLNSTDMFRPSGPRTIILIFLPEVIRARTVSEYLSNARPNTSNPAPRFAVEQKALPTACILTGLIGRSRPIAEPAADKRGLVPPHRAVQKDWNRAR